MAGKKWIGKTPIIGTLKYLDKGDIYLHKDVEIMAFNYLTRKVNENTQGAKRFVDFRLPQLQHRNPNIHFITYEDMTPTPFLQVFMKNDEEMLIDLFGKQSHEIWSHLKNVLGAEKQYLEKQRLNRGMIGPHKSQYDCICKVPGQLRCSSDYRRNTFRFGRRDEFWQRDYLSWYSTGFDKVKKKREKLENA